MHKNKRLYNIRSAYFVSVIKIVTHLITNHLNLYCFVWSFLIFLKLIIFNPPWPTNECTCNALRLKIKSSPPKMLYLLKIYWSLYLCVDKWQYFSNTHSMIIRVLFEFNLVGWFLAISWREQVAFRKDDVCFVLDQYS